MQPANTITEVIDNLEAIIQWAKAENSRLGCFPALYKRVTVKVKEGIDSGLFENSQRMEQLDVLFANRYLHAFSQFRKGEIPTSSWQFAFAARDEWWAVVLQHLLLGMNAHINLDLGIAAAQSMQGQNLDDLKGDFYKINDILVSLINTVEQQLGQVFPLMNWFNLTSGNLDELMAKFGIEVARDYAWIVAQQMAATPPEGWEEKIRSLDQGAHFFGQKVINPQKRWFRFCLSMVRLGEVHSTKRIIDILNA